MGYVLKENAVIDVIQAIYKVVEGKAYISLEMSGFLLKKVKSLQKEGPSNLQLLTPAERQILKLIAEFKSRNK
jgi:DNA-binding NarL/FixJ family response regulator